MMKVRFTLLIAAGLASVLTACSSGRDRGPPLKVINRALATAPGAAQPSTIVAREIEYARAAREEGQVTAAKRFSRVGAFVHHDGGVTAAGTFLNGQKNPDTSDAWGTATVVMSCDGQLAVTQGRYRDEEGIVGDYVTVWQRQRDGSYLWSYDVSGPDVPQPPPRREFEDGDIVVIAIPSIKGLVASCPERGEAVPAPPALPIEFDDRNAAHLSRDGTLRWRWEHREDGTKYVAADYYYDGEWVTAIEEGLAPRP